MAGSGPSAPRPLRVLTVAHNAVARSNRRRVEALSALLDVEVSLLTPRWWHEEGRRVEVRRTAPWRVGRTLFTGNGTRHFYVSGLLAAMRATRPDVIDLYEEPFSLVALQTLVLRRLCAPRAAVVFYSAVNVHRTWRWPYRAIERWVLASADGAHCPNQDVPRILRAKGLASQPVAVIPLGVDAERFAPSAPLAESGSVGHPDAPGSAEPRIGFVGRLEPVKGLDVLLAAFARLTAPAALVIAGDGSERARLQAAADAWNARQATPVPALAVAGAAPGPDERVARPRGRIVVLPPVPYEDLPGFLRSLDVLVLPSVTLLPDQREQFGRVLVEAMAAGVPVIGSSSGAIPEVVGDAGLIVPERDPAALAEAIARVLAEPDLRAELIQRGRQAATTRFAWPTIAHQTVALFHAAVAHRRQAAGPNRRTPAPDR